MLKTVLNSLKEKDIRKKLFFTLWILIVYRLGAYITVPGINNGKRQNKLNGIIMTKLKNA